MLKLYKILEEVESPINGKIQVVKTLEGIRILGAGLSQSGWLLKKIWDVALRRVKEEKPEIKKVLVLGLGGGSVAELISYYWPQASMTGVDKDKVMIDLGKRHLNLKSIPNLKIVLGDAEGFIKKTKGKFDIVLVDIYVGRKIPKQFKKREFIESVADLLTGGGVSCFNHIYSADEKEDAHNFGKKLRKIFPVVKEVRPEANIIFLCFTK